jgi:ABC-type molybdate transport system ATPase subunit
MDEQNPSRDDDVAEETEAMEALEQAVATLWREYDAAVSILMLTVDMFDEAQQKGQRINVPNYRRALGKQIRPAIQARDEALAALGIDPPEDA